MSTTPPQPFRPTRRQFVVGGLSLATVLAACGGDDGTNRDRDVTSSTASPGDAVDATAPAGGSTREIADVFGTVTVPAQPSKIVVLHPGVWGNLLAIGYPIAQIAGVSFGNVGAENFTQYAPYGDVGAIPSVATLDGPNLEQIVGLAPDLLLTASRGRDTDVAARDELAGTGVPVFVAFNGFLDLEEHVRLLTDTANAVNMAAAGAAAEADLRARIAELRGRLITAGDLPTVNLLQTFGDGLLYNQVSPLLDALGVPGNRADSATFTEEFSAEQLDQFSDDVLFVFGSASATEPKPEAADLEAFLSTNPLWSGLPAVQSGRVAFVSKATWNNVDLPSLHAILDDIERVLLPA